MPKRTADVTYRKNRAIILQGNPNCALCGGGGADTADHITPYDAGGGNEIENLRPAHQRCNSKAGAQYVNKKRAQQMQTRNNAMQKQKQTENDFFGAMTPPPTLCSVVSEANQPGLAVTGATASDQPLTGRTMPRLETPVLGAESYGPQVAQWALDHLGMSLMDWQVHALSGQLAHDANGDLVHRESCVSTGRQQGKTLAFSALIGWWLTVEATRRGEPQTVLSAAHKLDRASAVFLLLAPILEAKFGAKIGWSYGRQSATMPDGSRWEVRAATPQNAHGGSVDLAILDEIWSIPATVIFDAVRPSQIARKSPLLSMWSTAGDESSTAFLLLREQGINAIDAGVQRQLYFAEWSPPPGVNIDDQQWWAWSNPALGKTVQMSALVAASQSPDRASWLRAHLNLWVAAAQGWMPIGIWDQRKVDAINPAGGVLSIDSSVDDSRYVGVRSVANDDGSVTCTVEFTTESEQAMWLQVERVLTDQTVQLAITPTLDVHLPEMYRRRSTVVGYGELLKFTPLIRGMIIEGRLWHTGENSLAEHVNRAVMVKTLGGSALSSQKSPGPIELARCMIFASAMASRPITKNKPMLILVNR